MVSAGRPKKGTSIPSFGCTRWSIRIPTRPPRAAPRASAAPRPLGDHVVAEPLAQGAQLAVEVRVVGRADDDVHRAAVEGDDRRHQLPEADVRRQDEHPPAAAVGRLQVLPPLQGETPADLDRIEAGRGDGVAERGAEMAEAVARRGGGAPPRRARAERARGCAAPPAGGGRRAARRGAPMPRAEGARARVRQGAQAPFQRQVERRARCGGGAGAFFTRSPRLSPASRPPSRRATPRRRAPARRGPGARRGAGRAGRGA